MWTAPADAGDPIGCVATTFTFSAAFFEEECLARFLTLDSDPAEDGPAYLIEREEKLAQLVCATALVDQHHCVGERSLRWDLISARPPRGLLHAKVSLLHWSKLVRVIVSSANLTEDGYRRNLETFGVLDFARGTGAPRNLLREATRFLRSAAVASTPPIAADSPAMARWRKLLDRVDGVARAFGTNGAGTKRGTIKASLVFSGRGYPSVLEQLQTIWPGSSPPDHAAVLSPFFDPPDAPNRPAIELWARMRKRGKAVVAYFVTADSVPGESALFLHAPESLRRGRPAGRPEIETQLWRLELEENRPLHAKIVELADSRWVVRLVGSSNFTSAGLGLSEIHPNLEANIAYTVDAERDPKAHKLLKAAFPTGRRIPDGCDLLWMSHGDEGEDSAGNLVLLHFFFGDVVYECLASNMGHITLTLGEACPRGWRLTHEDDSAVLYDEKRWIAAGRPRKVSIPWIRTRPPSGLSVTWRDSGGSAWWPVSVRTSADLPPPEELRDLPLDTLIAILSSARPLHKVLAEFLRKKGKRSVSAGVIVVDPHKKVDTSQFLLQRTRRISAALQKLRERLERPVATVECLGWRLNGPVGVLALAKAVVRDARSDGERGFLISELALELNRVKPQTEPGALPPRVVLEEIKKAAAALRGLRPTETAREPDNLVQYIAKVFESLPE